MSHPSKAKELHGKGSRMNGVRVRGWAGVQHQDISWTQWHCLSHALTAVLFTTED